MDDITGIEIREHLPEQIIQKFPIWLSKGLLWLGLAGAVTFWILCFTMVINPLSWLAILYLLINATVLFAGMATHPYIQHEEYTIEITPRCTAIDLLVIQKKYVVEEVDLLVYRCIKKTTEAQYSDLRKNTKEEAYNV